MIYLASLYKEETKASIAQIANAIGENEHTVGKLLQTLSKADIINSSKGPRGGFFLSKEQFAQPLSKIVKAIDGADTFRKCGLGLSKCSEKHPCPIHHEFKEGRDLLEQLFNRKKISELYIPFEQGLTFLND